MTPSAVQTALGGALIVSLCLPSAPLAAADAPFPLGTGSHVRVWTDSKSGRLDGYVQALDEATLTLVSENKSTMAVPVDKITKLEVAFGRKGNSVKGALFGAAGAGITLAIVCTSSGGVLAATQSSNGSFSSGSYGNDCGVSFGDAALAVGTYSALGALIGAAIRSDRWVPVSKQPALAFAPTLRRGGAGFVVALSF